MCCSAQCTATGKLFNASDHFRLEYVEIHGIGRQVFMEYFSYQVGFASVRSTAEQIHLALKKGSSLFFMSAELQLSFQRTSTHCNSMFWF